MASNIDVDLLVNQININQPVIVKFEFDLFTYLKTSENFKF